MKTVRDVFTAAMALMDELDGDGGALHSGTREYLLRTPGIVDMMVSEYRMISGKRGIVPPVSGPDDYILNIDDSYAVGVMEYGLAANLLVDENPSAASFFQQRYEELRNIFFARSLADGDERIQDLYGGVEFGRFARW